MAINNRRRPDAEGVEDRETRRVAQGKAGLCGWYSADVAYAAAGNKSEATVAGESGPPAVGDYKSYESIRKDCALSLRDVRLGG